MNALATVGALANEQERFAMDIVESKGANLPATIAEIIPILAFSQAKMKAYNALSDAAKKVQEQEELNKAALESGQRWGIVHLYGQKRLGEITREIPTASNQNAPSQAPRKQNELKRIGITSERVSEAERIAAHPEILDRVIERAKESGDIPTKSAVLREIKAERDKELAEEYKREVLDKKEVVKGSPIEVQKCLADLRMAMHYVPADIPSEGWNEVTFAQAKSYAEIIIARLEKFNG